MDWLMKAFLAMVLFIPAFLVIPFFLKNFGVRPEATLVYSSLGTILGVIVWLGGREELSMLALSGPTIVIILFGFIGTAANIFFVQALASAPNPGLALAIVSSNTMPTFLMALALAALLPQYFESAAFNLRHAIGIVTVMIGIILILK
jgi:hypothetical protein